MRDLNGASKLILFGQGELQIQLFTHPYRVIHLETNAFFSDVDDLAGECLGAATHLAGAINPNAEELSLLSHRGYPKSQPKGIVQV